MGRIPALPVATALAFLARPALAQVDNPGFDNGFDGWTVVNTPEGVGAPGSIDVFDIDGPGPLPATPSANFSVGRIDGIGGYEGVILSQTIQLQAGTVYDVSFDWATVNNDIYPQLQSGLFSLYLGGEFVAQGDGNVIDALSANYGTVSTAYTPVTSGDYLLEITIERPFETFDDPTLLRQYVDNIAVVPAPAPAAVLAAVGFLAARRRRD